MNFFVPLMLLAALGFSSSPGSRNPPWFCGSLVPSGPPWSCGSPCSHSPPWFCGSLGPTGSPWSCGFPGSHGFPCPYILVLVVLREFFCSLDSTAPFDLIFPLVLLVPHDLVVLLVPLDLAVPLVLVVFHNRFPRSYWSPLDLVVLLVLVVLLFLFPWFSPLDLIFPQVLVAPHDLAFHPPPPPPPLILWVPWSLSTMTFDEGVSLLVFNSLCLPIQCTYPVQFIVPATPSKQNNNKADKNAKNEEKQVWNR